MAVTLDGGKTWRDTGIELSGTPVGPRIPGQSVQTTWGRVAGCVEADGTKTAVACGPGSSAQVFVSRDLLRWEQVDQAQFEWRPKHAASRAISVAAAPGGFVFAGTPDDCVLVSEDYGTTWKPVTGGVSGLDVRLTFLALVAFCALFVLSLCSRKATERLGFAGIAAAVFLFLFQLWRGYFCKQCLVMEGLLFTQVFRRYSSLNNLLILGHQRLYSAQKRRGLFGMSAR